MLLVVETSLQEVHYKLASITRPLNLSHKFQKTTKFPLPPLNLLQMHPQPSLRLRRDTPLNLRLTLRMRTALLKLDLKTTNPSSQQARKLRLCKSLTNTTPRPMQESKETVITIRTAAVVRRAISVQPALGLELESVGAPEGCGGVNGPGSEDDGRAFGDELACECGVVGGDAHGEGYGGPEAQDFGTDGVQVVAVVDVCGGDLVLD